MPSTASRNSADALLDARPCKPTQASGKNKVATNAPALSNAPPNWPVSRKPQ